MTLAIKDQGGSHHSHGTQGTTRNGRNQGGNTEKERWIQLMILTRHKKVWKLKPHFLVWNPISTQVFPHPSPEKWQHPISRDFDSFYSNLLLSSIFYLSFSLILHLSPSFFSSFFPFSYSIPLSTLIIYSIYLWFLFLFVLLFCPLIFMCSRLSQPFSSLIHCPLGSSSDNLLVIWLLSNNSKRRTIFFIYVYTPFFLVCWYLNERLEANIRKHTNLVCKCSDRNAKCPGQSKICKL